MKFSHVYVESKALDFPVTKSILEREKRAVIIEVKNYKDVFNRSKQDFVFQKNSPKLILAKKEENFLYKGSRLTPNFGNRNFYYNSVIFNCLYNCDYCYLQGMYQSAYITIFVNIEDFFSSVEEKLQSSDVYLSASYDTDLLAFERIFPFTSAWIEFARKNPGLLIEIRTKSSNFTSISKIKPTENIILAWTLSPDSIVKEYENKSPSLNRRLENALRAIESGWKVRLCFDPILAVPDYQQVYKEMFCKVFSKIPSEKILDVSAGVFRMNSDYLKKIQRFRMDSDILFSPFEEYYGVNSYPDKKISEIANFLLTEIRNYTEKPIDFNRP